MSKINGILQKIKDTLEEFNLPVFYGRSMCKANDNWDYFVFNRLEIAKSGKSNLDYNYKFQIHIINEEFIDEGFEIEVIKKITENTKLKLVDKSHSYNYTVKNNTDLVVEMLTLEFTKTFKGCDL